jgi:hypothetical protein
MIFERDPCVPPLLESVPDNYGSLSLLHQEQ